MKVYQTLVASGAFVNVQPSVEGLQDQVYAANMAVVLSHIEDKEIAVVSNFESVPRRGETKPAEEYLKSIGYETIVCPFKFEGEADLKYINDNVYIGAYGQRTEKKALEWFEKEYDMKVIPYEMNDPYLYHLDCNVFPIHEEAIILNTEGVSKAIIKEIEKNAEIIPTEDLDFCYSGLTNSVKVGRNILMASDIEELSKDNEFYELEKEKIGFMESVCNDFGLEPIIINISEMYKSGAMLSCLVMSGNLLSKL
jgi:N-dimethylarginine dimethylaminohydrolase